MPRSRIVPALSAGVLALCLVAAAKADSLTGTTIAQTATASIGTLNFSSASASVGAGIEFTNVLHWTGYPDLNIYQDFSDAGLTITLTSPTDYANVFSSSSDPVLSLTYTDSAFSGLYAFQSYSCTGNALCGTVPASGYSTSFRGSTLTVNLYSLLNGQTYTFAPSAAATATTPEPGSLALTLTGLLGAVGVLRRRLPAFARA